MYVCLAMLGFAPPNLRVLREMKIIELASLDRRVGFLLVFLDQQDCGISIPFDTDIASFDAAEEALGKRV